MKVVPREAEKLNLNNAGFFAQKRLVRGLTLNHPKAAALIATQVCFLLRNFIFCSNLQNLIGFRLVCIFPFQTGNKFFLVFNIFCKGGTVGDIGSAYQRCISAGIDAISWWQCGMDANATDRALLQSSKPFLHTNVYCNVLISAIVSQQISVARLLLQVILKPAVLSCTKLLQHHSPNIPHFGRTLIHHAILCNNERAVEVLLNCSADVEVPIKTTNSETDCPVHMSASIIAESARWALGFQHAVVEIQSGEIVQSSHTSIFSTLMLVTQANDVEASKKLIEGADVDLNEQDEKGYSAAMISAEGGYLESFKLLIDAGADINLQNKRGQTVLELFDTTQNGEEFEKLFKNAAPQKVLDSPVEFYGTLHQAVQDGTTDFVHTLRSMGSDVLLMPMDTLC
ncbi:serine/threonine-protein phosphatase 6 regulatory ankyrin repeat subunit B-like [Pyrus ussuriensis x Pyrus communis]|uniref:Serine/threonine-protein phosphatase 6 regulatory ankyrin repeat subunit B-like n=1 Tax=Pyrus ussuriensis x Pyrus communis TaxID=2448454 RepID=A0A5N5HA48_9ROSA|nr:serine/threonine-protein phosphatase 6 regulatory ankyrin repeat subunit B-like [Pyrus ussuriensis x Pyrus communis]